MRTIRIEGDAFHGLWSEMEIEIVNYSNGTSQMNGLFIVCIRSYHVSKH